MPALNRQELTLWTLQVSVMLNSGVGLLKALEACERTSSDPRVEQILTDIRRRVLEGNYLSESLSHHPATFSGIYIALIRSGEAGGGLAQVMQRLAEWLRRDQEVLQRLKGALTYPLAVMSLSLLLMVTVFATILPSLAELLEGSQQLPWYSQFLLNLIDWIKSPATWLVGLTFLGALLALARERLASEAGQIQIYEFAMWIPILREFLREAAMVRFCSASTFLLFVGVDLCRSLQLAAATSGSPLLRDEIPHVLAGIREGEPLSVMIRELSYCPRMLVQMVNVGEESARLSDMFAHLARHFESELQYRTQTLMSLLEPAMLLLLAGMVGFLAISLMVPLYGSLSQLG